MIVVSTLAGYLIGSLPTAGWLAGLWGIDLRQGGTGNPGANNARRLGGVRLALIVLLVEMSKGLVAVMAGEAMASEVGAVAAGLGAVTGNVYNVWYRFEGGKGLGITGGVLIGLWPAGFPLVLLTLAVASALTRSTGMGTLITLVFLLAGALFWDRTGFGASWGVTDAGLLFPLALGLCILIGPRHWQDARNRVRSPARP